MPAPRPDPCLSRSSVEEVPLVGIRDPAAFEGHGGAAAEAEEAVVHPRSAQDDPGERLVGPRCTRTRSLKKIVSVLSMTGERLVDGEDEVGSRPGPERSRPGGYPPRSPDWQIGPRRVSKVPTLGPPTTVMSETMVTCWGLGCAAATGPITDARANEAARAATIARARWLDVRIGLLPGTLIAGRSRQWLGAVPATGLGPRVTAARHNQRCSSRSECPSPLRRARSALRRCGRPPRSGAATACPARSR